MEFRNFGKLDWKVSALGFGCMRLPTSDGKPLGPNIDEAEAIRMLRHAIDEGVNYIDTAYGYHGGNSEIVVGKALLDGYREKVRVASKSPVWLIKEATDFDKLLAEQLERLQTDHIDFYMLHALGRQSWNDVILKLGILEKATAAIQDGRIRHLGFSFHDDHDAFVEILNGYDWTFCLMQHNYMDTENQAGTKGLKLAAEKGLAVVIMEPLYGGRLANPPQDIQAVIDNYPTRRSAADWALQWLWNQPEVSAVLSGMSDMTQVDENLQSAGKSGVASFTEADVKVVEKFQQMYNERTAVPCTKCSYCMPCPSGVNIPHNFSIFNAGYMYDDMKGAKDTYSWAMTEAERAVNCTQCKACEERCPQKIEISEWMPKLTTLLNPSE